MSMLEIKNVHKSFFTSQSPACRQASSTGPVHAK